VSVVQSRSATPDRDAWDHRRGWRLGPVQLSVLPLAGRLVHHRTPERWQLTLACDGPLTLRRARAATRLRAGDLLLNGPSGTPDVTEFAADAPSRAMVLHLPRHLLPPPEPAVLRATGRPLPSRVGPAALPARFVLGLAEQTAAEPHRPEMGAADWPDGGAADWPGTGAADWLGAAAIDLASASLTSVSTADEPGIPLSRQAALLRSVKAYIAAHLHEPDRLSPTAIAAAHHISVRHLHALFRPEKRTVAALVREQRMERCRADLANPAHTAESIGEIRCRWGFRDAAVFGRAFKKRYGLSPAEYRRCRP
jgi:AraC-like DNA-binding protein